MKGEHGIFKESLGYGTKDHIVEAIVYNICIACNVDCAFAKVRKTHNSIGIFSRFEIPDGYRFIHASEVFGVNTLHISDLLSKSTEMAREFKNTALLTVIYKYLIIDYLTGQLDRHMNNLALLEKDREILWYKMYDNGIALSANYANVDMAIERLNSGFFDTRIGNSIEIKEEILKYRKLMKLDSIRLEAITYASLETIIDRCDVYNQLSKTRREAMIAFILRQKQDIESW